MTPMVRSYLDQIQTTLAHLEVAVAKQKIALAKERKGQEDLLKRFWSRQKEVTVLGQGREDYEALYQENLKLKSVHAELRERLGRLLECTKALGSDLRQ